MGVLLALLSSQFYISLNLAFALLNLNTSGFLFGPGYSSDTAGDGPKDGHEEKKTSTKKRRRIDSLGSKVLPEVTRKEKLKRNISWTPEAVKSDAELDNMVIGQKTCCSKNHEKGCFMEIFLKSKGVYDVTSAYEFCRNTQEIARNKNPRERKEYLQEIFRSVSHLDERDNTWVHNFSLRVNSIQYPVCRQVFAEVHGFTKYSFDSIASVLKNSKTHRVCGEHHRAYGDSIPPFSYNEYQDICDDNIRDGTAGKFNYYCNIKNK